MDYIKEQITEWLKEILVDGILSNLAGLFDNVNQEVGNITAQVGTTPQGWNGGIYSMIHNLSESVIVPIAGLILAFVMTLELIQLIMDKNNMHDVDTWMFFKWIFKTACAILIVTNTWNIVMAVFDVAQSVVNSASGVIVGNTSIDISSAMTDMETRLMAEDLGYLFGLWFQSLFIGVTMWALSICIFIITYGRMIEIYLVTSVAPIPMATMTNREWGQMGQNYLRSLFALGFQGFLIIVCVGIYAVLVQNIASQSDWELQKEYVDTAAEMGWPYVLLDGGWDSTNYEKITEFCTYAEEKGVKVLVWLDALSSFDGGSERTLTRRLKRYAQCGVDGVKVDFFDGQTMQDLNEFQGEDTEMIKWYETVYQECAKLKLVVNCHGSNKPTGERRIYPNVICREGVRAYEMYGNLGTNEIINSLFIRGVIGPADFTARIVSTE